jgi:hypothetical protein
MKWPKLLSWTCNIPKRSIIVFFLIPMILSLGSYSLRSMTILQTNSNFITRRTRKLYIIIHIQQRIGNLESWGHILFHTDIEHQLLDVGFCLGIWVEACQDVLDIQVCQAGRSLPCDEPKIRFTLNMLNSCSSICNTEWSHKMTS